MQTAIRMFLALLFPVTALPGAGWAQDRHDYLEELYNRLHASPAQEKFRALAPMPIGAVYIQAPGEGEKEIREHMRAMTRLGFTNLKQVMTVPGTTFADVAMIALDEGIIPWWYDEAGWEPITGALLKKLGIPKDTPMEQVRTDPRMLRHQTEVMRERVRRIEEYKKTSPDGREPRGGAVAFDPQVGGRGFDLTDEGRRLFVEWARNTYGDIDRLNHAWNQYHTGLTAPGGPFRSWEDFAARWETVPNRENRRYRDILRFKADNSLEHTRRAAEAFRDFDPHAPFRGGGELGLFLPQAWYGVDLEGIGDIVKDHGSFYPSIHLVWHFDEVGNELVRPFYMMSSLSADFVKGGWAGAWEATGGPQQLSGYKGGTGFTVDGGVMTQFILSQIAGGFKGFGLWAWSSRTAGTEGGEYALLDRNREVTPRAEKVGRIGQAMRRYRDELWKAHKEPYVGVYVDWDNEGMWAALGAIGRDTFPHVPIAARVGVSRALINADVPFEYVTASDLRSGLGPRYRVIYLPAALAIPNDMLGVLLEYVRQGGRVVMDMPGGWYDEYGALVSSKQGSPFERLFGVKLRDYQYSGTNVDWRLDGKKLEGFTADLAPTSAQVLARYDNGQPAVTENRYGKGTAVILGYEASLLTDTPGNPGAERLLVERALGPYEPPFSSAEAIVYRLAAPQTDHYFLINDGPATSARLDTGAYRYRRVSDAVTGEELRMGAPVPLEAHSGRWLRFEK